MLIDNVLARGGGSMRLEDEDELSLDSEDLLEAMDESLLSEDERSYRAARRLADRKVALSHQALRAAAITIPMLIFVPFFGVLSLIYFAVRLGRRAFKMFYEPRLHEHFVQDEVQRQVRTRVTKERRELEGEHHRSLEQLSASIAHEIRNPITAAKSLVQQLGEDAAGVDQALICSAMRERKRHELRKSRCRTFSSQRSRPFGIGRAEEGSRSSGNTMRRVDSKPIPSSSGAW